MLRDIDNLRSEMDRVRRPRSATITPSPGGPSIEVTVGDIVEIEYAGERRRVRVLAVMPWGLRCWDMEKKAPRVFKFERIGRETPREMDAAASG